MAGQQFQFDDSRNTFYFLTSFMGLITTPVTYYLWPRDENADSINFKKNEPPLTCPYSLEARVFLLSHLLERKFLRPLKKINNLC
ncbi:hypothetical protein FD755_025408 [Muntiacus reevesi]|uniref:Uncharacterized protein n=1 Tax=Muntiacus reevesi TaxID=9886 RepID=A0A5N3UMN1_MUNRE|nr:hypothetical protein FD755_025408 [Muntiacus reevesi]